MESKKNLKIYLESLLSWSPVLGNFCTEGILSKSNILVTDCSHILTWLAFHSEISENFHFLIKLIPLKIDFANISIFCLCFGQFRRNFWFIFSWIWLSFLLILTQFLTLFQTLTYARLRYLQIKSFCIGFGKSFHFPEKANICRCQQPKSLFSANKGISYTTRDLLDIVHYNSLTRQQFRQDPF